MCVGASKLFAVRAQPHIAFQIRARSLLLWNQLISMGVESVVPLLGVYINESKRCDLQLAMPECVPAIKWLVAADYLRRYRAFVHLIHIKDIAS